MNKPHILQQAYMLDPELSRYNDCRLLIEMGADIILSITEKYGTPSQPKWFTLSIYK